MFNRDAVKSKKRKILAIKSKNTKSRRTWSFTSASSLSGSSPTGSTRKLSIGGTDISDTDLEHLYSELGIKPMFSVARLALEDLSEEDTTAEKPARAGKKIWWAVKGVSYFGMSFVSILILFYLLRL